MQIGLQDGHGQLCRGGGGGTGGGTSGCGQVQGGSCKLLKPAVGSLGA